MSDQRPWFDTAFERGYLELYPHRDRAAAAREVAALVSRGLDRARGALLDLGCGFGRHLEAFVERGFEVVGLDRSPALLAAAPPALRGRLVRGDFRSLPFAGGQFGAVVMLFSSFGYFDDAGNERTLAELARVLAPGGRAVLDLMNPPRVRATLVPESRSERDGLVLHERRALERAGTRVTKEVVVQGVDGRERRWREDVRLYEPAEVRELLTGAGLLLERFEGDFDGRAWNAEAPRELVWARKPPLRR
jgi:SAM-dependent methyltransferase